MNTPATAGFPFLAARAVALAALVALLAPAPADDPPDRAPAGVHKAEAVASSPKITGSGMAWWGDRLIVADRGGKRLLAFTPPDKFETFAEGLTPVGVAAAPDGSLVVVDRGDDGPRLLRFTADGKRTVLASDDVGTPQFLAVHATGTVYWSGFPDGGTRVLAPGGKPTALATKIGHTYGAALSPKQDWLYVSSKLPNAERRGVWRFPLDAKGVPGEAEFFLKVQALEPDVPDLPAAKDGAKSLLGWVGRLQGIAVDSLGNLYVAGAESHTSGEAVAVVAPDGKKVAAMILGVPRNVSGLAFGGADGRTLFVTGAGEYPLHQVRLPVRGAGR